VTAAVLDSRAGARRRSLLARRASPYLLVLPSAVFIAVIFGWPMISGLGDAFTEDGAFTLDHWRQMVDDPEFWPAVRHTLLLMAAIIPLQFVFAIAMALLLQARPRFSGFYFYIWVVPLAVSDLAAGLVWLTIFADRGYLNSFLDWFGVDLVEWLSYQNPSTMFLAIVVAEVWRATSLVLVIVVAGMQLMPRDYDEAAQVFGASFWQRLRHVILPQLKPSLQVALILRTILALQTFAVVQALTGLEYPVLVGESYRWTVVLYEQPVGSAIAMVLLAMAIAFSIVYLWALRPTRAGRTTT
jgi:multiple sugar transport system permease protein